MSALATLLESDSCKNLIMALLHTLWQGVLVAGVLWLYLRSRPAEATGKRYLAGVVALAAIVLGGLLTWSVLNYEPARPTQVHTTSAPAEEAVGPQVASGAAEPTSPAPPPNVAGGEPSPGLPRWQVWAMVGWLAGVVLMLIRTAAVLIGGGRLRRRCRPVTDEQILGLVAQLRAELRIGRRIGVYVGEHISVPGVVGCFWPALLLPASMTSGIPVDDLRAILTHELAHIKRYDYLVNFCQMVIEALLFFNPAVWWISRQIRIEREACCDAAGVALTGQRTRYAEVLVGWAQRLREGHLAAAVPMAFGKETDASGLLDRIKRITVAGHRPRLRVSWHIATAMIALSLLCLAGIWQGTNLAVALAGRILTPQERIERITEISKEYGYEGGQYGAEDKIRISGVVRTWDGQALPRDRRMILRSQRPRNNYSMAINISGDGTFDAEIDYGRIFMIATAKGYAAAFAGPFEPEPGTGVEGIVMVLEEGFVGRIRLVDAAGQPVEGAQLVGGYTYPDDGSYHHTIKLRTDRTGEAVIEHAGKAQLALQIEADGFEPERLRGLVLDPDKPHVVTLKAAQPSKGIVVSQANGEPIADAEIRVLISMQGSHSYSENSVRGGPEAVTDAQGRFELTQLRGDRRYFLFVRAPGYGYRYVPDVMAGDDRLRIALGEKKVIRGRIIGDLTLLEQDKSGKPSIRYTNSYTYAHHSDESSSERSVVEVRDGVGYFEIADFTGQIVKIHAGEERLDLLIEEDALEDIVIDLSGAGDEPARRQVVLRFEVPDGAPALQGGVRVDCITERAQKRRQGMTPDWIEIVDGEARCEIPVPGRFKYGIDYYRGKRPVGFWFKESVPMDVVAADTPLVLNVPVHPAGALYGQILRPDGNLAKSAHASLIVAKRPEVVGPGLHDLGNTLYGGGLDRGKFNATPLPLGGEYAIVAHEGNAYALAGPVRLDERNQIVEKDIRLVEGVTLSGRLLDTDGTPARDLVALGVSVKCGESSWGTRGPEIRPDENGRFSFDDINPDFEGTYRVDVSVGPGYRPVRQEVKKVRAPVTIQLEAGKRLTGVVIDDATGWPVPEAEVYAFFYETVNGKGTSEHLEAEGKTNERGEFVFSNMAQRRYRINVRSANLAEASRPVLATGGQTGSVTLRITLPEWSELKPREPQVEDTQSELKEGTGRL